MKPNLLTNEQVCSFCTALEHLIRAGIGLGDALVLLKEDEQDTACRQMLERMALQADQGASLSVAVRETGRFPTYVSALLEVGERAGKTEQTLEALARYYENRERMDRYLRASFMYPAVLMAVLLVVVVVLLVWVLPVFNDVYARLGSELTGVAGGLLSLGAVLRKGLPVICGILAVIAAVWAVKPLRHGAVRWWNRLMGDRGAGKAMLSARFVQALAMANSSGMPQGEALALACSLSQTEAPAFQKRCEKCREEVESGISMIQALAENGFLTAADRRLLAAGKRGGREELVLLKIAQSMMERGEEAMERRAGCIEPAIVIVACVLIGTILLSVMLPLMHIMTAIG